MGRTLACPPSRSSDRFSPAIAGRGSAQALRSGVPRWSPRLLAACASESLPPGHATDFPLSWLGHPQFSVLGPWLNHIIRVRSDAKPSRSLLPAELFLQLAIVHFQNGR